MRSPDRFLAALMLPPFLAAIAAAGCATQAGPPMTAEAPHPQVKFGKPISNADLASWDIDIRTTDGKGLPVGRGTVAEGKAVYDAKCIACHGADAKGGWEQFEIMKGQTATSYQLVEQEGVVVIQADSAEGGSGLSRKLHIDPRRYPIIEWRWRVPRESGRGGAAHDHFQHRVQALIETLRVHERAGLRVPVDRGCEGDRRKRRGEGDRMGAAPDDVERDRVRAGSVVRVGDGLPQRAGAGVGGGRHRERRGPRSGGRGDSEGQGNPQGTNAHFGLLGVRRRSLSEPGASF